MFKNNCQFDGNMSKLSKKQGIFTCEANRSFEIFSKIQSLLHLEKPLKKRTEKRIENLETRLSNQVEKQYCPTKYKYMSNRPLLDQIFNIN